MSLAFAEPASDTVPIHFVTRESWTSEAAELPERARNFARASGFEPKAGRMLLVPGDDGAISRVLFALASVGARGADPFLPGELATRLPPGTYRFANEPHDAALAALAFLLASYRFGKYKSSDKEQPRLVVPDHVDREQLQYIAAAVARGRDLINTPTNDLGPQALEEAIVALADEHGSSCTIVRGDDLLAKNFPLIHAVGRASAEAPRIVDFHFGAQDAQKVTLVGKGVCFDTGGLDIKPSAGMLIMKKDMGGAATALALASMIMDAKLPLRLRVIIPIVENAIAGNAFRPGDIYRSRKGLTVEIGNTDAEGRLILADALALADEDEPDLLFDFATLTGAARVALGPDLPPMYSDDDALADACLEHGRKVHDPIWRMPLWSPYDKLLDGRISDLVNVSSGPFAGSITAALFLRRFVERAKAWAHFDVYAWNPKTLPGRPEGGDVQVARLILSMLADGYVQRR
ncbi:MAG: leucyl aminopeptidase family protein [Methylobacteriaceae bacterium]|nr:leucyl aminopeptidase family protein [Methylobacteriaceae bacterium]